jgi:hypothetical protein
MPRDAPVITATFLSLLMLVSFVLPPHSPWPCEIILDARDSGLGAGLILVAAGRSPDAERGDNFVSDLDRDPAREECNVGSVPSAGPAGFLAASAANALEVSNLKIGPKVTTVYALRKADVVVPMVEWSPLA